MPFQRFLIAPFKTGLQTDLRPWQIMDDAFEQLQNAYVFRGRLRKRIGSLLMGPSVLNSRLRVQVGVTTSGALTTTVPGSSDIYSLVGQAFSVQMQLFTVWQLGNPATMLSTGVGSGTFNTSTGQVVITGTGSPDNTPVYWYPGQPVMGITQYESGAVNNHPTYAFDPQFAYIYAGGGWERSGAAIWNGNDLDFFWATNWQGVAGTPVLFVTNFNATVPTPAGTDDPIWWTVDGSAWTSGTGANAFYFLPAGGAVNTGSFVVTARIIVAFKNRLVLLNTIENNGSGSGGTNTAYVNRCRYSFNGSPFVRNAWYEPNQMDTSGSVVNNNNIAAGAGYIDATTEEQIISAEFIKDRLIVYFERSTWELAYTGNEILPFVWQKINTELGSQSTFSTVSFDKTVLTIGNTGIHACSGTNVERIDNLIPDEIFDAFETNDNATQRTAGIRDYFNEMVYWTFVTTTETPGQTFPNQLLVYNYQNGAWALNDDCFTAFGYFEQGSDLTWATSTPITWETFNGTWIDNITHANDRQILAGTPEGFVLRLASAVSRNAAAMQITQITYNGDGTLTLTIINHNFSSNSYEFSDEADYILIENVVGDDDTESVLNYEIFAVNAVFNDEGDPNPNQIMINTNYTEGGPLVSGTYDGGGTGARVSQIQILTKQFNPYDKDDRNVYIQKVDFGVQKTPNGKITVDYYPSATDVSMIQGGNATGSIMGNSILETSAYDPAFYPLEQYQERLWHPVYFQTSAECIQFYLYLSTAQMTDVDIALSDFQLEGMILYATSTDSRMQ